MKAVGIAVAFVMLAGSCADDSDPAGDMSTTSAPVEEDKCGQGEAFPGDPEFREAVCLPLLALVDLLGTNVEIRPEWSTRITAATQGYDDDRDASLAELAAVLAEIQAAG